MEKHIEHSALKHLWAEYYILDSVNRSNNISTYPVNENKNDLLDLIQISLTANLIFYNSSTEKLQLTQPGKKRLFELYTALNLNKYNRHLYPNINDLI